MRLLILFCALLLALTACGGSETTDSAGIEDGKDEKGKKSKGKSSKGKDGKDAKGKDAKGKDGKDGKEGKGKMKGDVGENEAYDDEQTCCRKGGSYSFGGSRKACNAHGGDVIEGSDSCLLICCQAGGSHNSVLKGNCNGNVVPDSVCGM